jgi:hypothetical protein
MQKPKSIAKTFTPYAASADFCRIFHVEMSGLYLLSLLLTADPENAERCFLQSLEDSAGCTSVFKEWASSWARRTIIHNAIRLIDPRPADGISIPTPASRGSVTNVQTEIAAVVDLPVFERLVFVRSGLFPIAELFSPRGSHGKEFRIAADRKFGGLRRRGNERHQAIRARAA